MNLASDCMASALTGESAGSTHGITFAGRPRYPGRWQEVATGLDDPFVIRAQLVRLVNQVQSSRAELTTAKRHHAELLAAVSHELRSSLAAIRNDASLLDIKQVEAIQRQHAQTRIQRQVGRMARLVDDLLEVSQIGRPPLCAPARVDLCVVLQQAIETVQSYLDERRHRLTIELPAAPVWLQADSGRLEQVFVNLLINAAKYTEPGGELRLTAQQEQGEAVVRMRDSGIGIAPDKLPHVFDLFMQVNRSARRVESGLGIGLALVRSFVEAHGGHVEATSAGLGQGSEFTVRLPTA